MVWVWARVWVRVWEGVRVRVRVRVEGGGGTAGLPSKGERQIENSSDVPKRAVFTLTLTLTLTFTVTLTLTLHVSGRTEEDWSGQSLQSRCAISSLYVSLSHRDRTPSWQ